MKSKRLMTYKCGHEEEVELSTSWSFDNLIYCDCDKCKREKGVRTKMKISFHHGDFIASTEGDMYDYKEILEECGMCYDPICGWYYSFDNSDYKEILDKKIEILKEHKIIIDEIIEDGNLKGKEEKYYRILAFEKLKKGIVEIMPNNIDKESDEFGEYKEIFHKEMERLTTLSIEELKNYDFYSNHEDDEETQEKIAKKELLNSLKKEAAKEVEEKVLTPRPSFTNEGYWNKKVYGSKGNRSVYVGREKRSITEEEYEQWITYEKSVDEFRRIRGLILGMNLEQLQNKEYLIEIEGEEIRENATLEVKRDILKDKPNCINGYWNGRFYGKKEREIYIDNKKRTLSDEEYQFIQDYQNSIEKYNEIIKKIDSMSLVDLKNKEYKKFYIQ